MAKGYLVVNVYADNIAQPLDNAKVTIVGNNTNLELFTNESGQTDKVELDAPDLKYSEEEQSEVNPYSVYTVTVSKDDFTTVNVVGVEVYPDELSMQDVYLTNKSDTLENEVTINIDPPTLWKDYPPTVIDDFEDVDVAPLVLENIVIPSTIVVHDGIPSNKNAVDYTVSFTDYIKNVACSEIYSTWPKETLKANILAIISFTLNRIYTEWYISRGYHFNITSTTTYDQKYTRGRTIFDSISKVVDEIFNNYIGAVGTDWPLLAHYQVATSEAGYLSQWGSKYLGDQGYSALEILKYYYGNVGINKADISKGDYPYSYPDKVLKIGDCSKDVQTIQNQLNYIGGSYPAIVNIKEANGYFGEDTQSAVKIFQNIFGLDSNGEVDFSTWYKISYIYVSIRDMLKSIY